MALPRILPARSKVVVFAVRPTDAILPEDCACCGAVATRTLEERRGLDGSGLLVPYCSACHRHATATATAELALFWSTLLLSSTAAFGVPLLLGPPGRLVVALLVLVASGLPAVVYLAWPRPAEAGHASRGRAAAFRFGALQCHCEDWGERAARASGVAFERRTAWAARVPSRVLVTCVIAAGAAALLLDALFPVIHVVNGGAEPLRIFVDGKERAVVRPSGSEYASSFREIRVLAGPRSFVARTPEGQDRDPVRFDVGAGRDYLYAPDSRGTCFRVERASYGRDETPPSTTPLAPTQAFWEISPPVDLWFSPPPARSPDRHSSGGSVRAVRRAPCGGESDLSGSPLETSEK